MYVFYDEDGEIKAIAPSRNDFHDESCSIAMFPLSDVEPFIQGKKNTFNYIVKKIKNFTGERFILTQKVIEVNYVRTLDNYLTEIGNIEPDTTIISIINDKKFKVVKIELASDFRSLYTSGSETDRDIINEIIESGRTAIHLTEKHNPYYLLFSMSFSPKELFEKGRLSFKYTGIVKNASAYTKKIVSGYGYKEVY